MLDKIIKVFDTIVNFFKPQYRYYKDHRDTPKYKKKKSIVKNVWIISGIVMISLSSHPKFIFFVFFISIFTTFIAFFILEEMGEGWRNDDD